MPNVIEINVKRTGCKKTEIINELGNSFDLNVKGKPENGEANKEIEKFFSKEFKCSVKVVRGLKSKKKLVVLE